MTSRARSACTARTFQSAIPVTINFYDRWRSGDWNTADHRNVGVVLLDAASDAGNPWIFPELLDEGFKPLACLGSIAI